MRIDIIAVIPEMLSGALEYSIIKRARDNGILNVYIHDLKSYGLGKFYRIDDYQYGGGGGMVIRCEPVFECIETLTSERHYDEVIYLTPDGTLLNQPVVNSLSLKENLILLCGHYKGIDQRIRDELITKEISIGDYVLTGGEIAAIVLTDAIGRVLPGAMNNESSALTDSFQDGLLASPVYTRPPIFRNLEVPDILLSGHEAKIENWRLEKSLEKTKIIRPDLL